MPKTYHYEAFGLTISSTFFINYLDIVNPTQPDVKIFKSAFVKPNSWDESKQFHFSDNDVIINFKGQPFIKVSQGKEIIINSNFDSCEKELEVFILASSIATILIQRKYLLIHGATLVHNDEAIVFVGPKGIGKSTLSAGLVARGHKVIGDDICVIYKDKKGIPITIPSIPTLKLTEESHRKLKLNNKITSTHVDLKFWHELPPTLFKHFPIKRIYHLTRHDNSEVKTMEIFGSKSIDIILKNLYRPAIVTGLGQWKNNFSLIGETAKVAQVKDLRRPETGFEINKILDKIECEIGF